MMQTLSYLILEKKAMIKLLGVGLLTHSGHIMILKFFFTVAYFQMKDIVLDLLIIFLKNTKK